VNAHRTPYKSLEGTVTRTLLIITAVIELVVGLALLLVPSVASVILVGAPFDTPLALLAAHLAGIALCALATACWLVRNDAQSHAATGVVAAMWLYNSAVAVLLIDAGVVGLRGWALWPVVVFHVVMAAWCGACVRGSRFTVRPVGGDPR
jgi:hypothetical protein